MRTVIGFICLALLLWVERASATEWPLTVSVHQQVLNELTPQVVKRRLEEATRSAPTLPTSEPNGCNVRFKVDGPVRPFASPTTPKDINGPADLEAVHRETAHVKIVRQINYCWGSPPWLGCAWRDGNRPKTMIISAQGLQVGFKHILWAHEFGHTTGLPHRRGDDPLMTPCALSYITININAQECQCFRAGPGGACASMPDPHVLCSGPGH